MTTNVLMGCTYTFFKNGEEVASTKNLLTDAFFNRIFNNGTWGTPNVGRYICVFVGTGTTTPAVTDTGMEANVATSAITNNFRGNDNFDYRDVTTDGTTNYGNYDWTVTFGAGSFAGETITEVGARFSSTQSVDRNTPTVIDSHALIIDGNGNVTGILLSATDILTVKVRFTLRVPTQERCTLSYNGSSQTVEATAIMCGTLSSNDNGWQFWSPFNLRTGAASFMLNSWGNGLPTLPNTGSPWGWTAIGLSGSQTPDTPDTVLTNLGSKSHTLDAISYSNRVLTYTKSITDVTLLTSTGLGRFRVGNNSAGHFLSFVFNPLLTGVGDVLALTVRFRFGQLSTGNEELTLDVQPNPTTITETVANGTSTTVGEGRAIIVTGGVAPFTYSWAYVSGGSALLSADSASSASTTFTGTGTSQTSNELWRCTVTDSSSTPQVVTVDVNVNITWA